MTSPLNLHPYAGIGNAAAVHTNVWLLPATALVSLRRVVIVGGTAGEVYM